MTSPTLTALAQLLAFTPVGAALTADEEAFITRNEIGSFVLFARNIPDLASAQRMIAYLHALIPQPLIAVDQEGGRVIRLPAPATHLPSAMALGATRSADLAFRAGQATARELRALRLNAVLVPVMDVNNNPANPVIGTRAFGDTPEHVTQMGVAWLRGAQSEGVAACAKHFPGHGDTQIDSHAALPHVTKPRDALERIELAPFRAAVTVGVEMVMPGHLLVSALDAAHPSSLSRATVTDLLRGEMGFTGVVITDALDMHAVALEYGIPGAAVEAARAGCDLLCCITHFEESLAALQRALDDGRLMMQRVEESVRRVRALRERLAAVPPADAAWLGAHQALAHQIARQAIRVSGACALPLQDLGDCAVIEFALGRVTIAEGASVGEGKLLSALRTKHEGEPVQGMALPFNPDEQMMQPAVALAESARGLVVATRRALHFPTQQALVRRLLALGKPTVLIALRDPYDLDLFPAATCTIATYDDSPAMVDELVSLLVG